MIIFLYGPNSYQCQKKQKEIVSQYQSRHSSLTIEKFNLEEDGSLEKLKVFAKAGSLFDVFKLAIIYNFSNEIGDLLKDQINNKELVMLVLGDKAPPKNFEFLVKPPVIFQKFQDLDSEQLKKFIIKEARQRSLNVSQREVDNLLLQSQGDCWAIINELDKLALSPDWSRALAPRLNQYNFFNSINGLGANQLKERLGSLEALLTREDPVKVFNSIVYAWGFDRAVAAAYDLAIKSGKLDYETALLDLTIK